jgi:hypothetical protein
MLAAYCLRHGLDLPTVRAAIRCGERLDALRYRSHSCPSSDRESHSRRVEVRLLREQMDHLRAELRRVRQDAAAAAAEAARDAVDDRLTAELPDTIHYLVAHERTARNGTPA